MILRILLVFLAVAQHPFALGESLGLHLPIVRRQVYSQQAAGEVRGVRARSGGTASIGIGDYVDVTYNVLIQVGGVQTPLVLDTGSADLWVISETCQTDQCQGAGVPLYRQSSFQATGHQIQLLYGDSHTGTQADGPIGKDTVGIAGLSVSNQYLAAIVNTNTTVLETGSAGILGFGFPAISLLWRQLLQAQLNNQPPSRRDLAVPFVSHRIPFPDFDFLRNHVKRQSGNFTSSAEAIASMATYGPLLARLIAQGMLESPMFTITLQRDTVDIGGDIGLLSIGQLPPGISTSSLTWVPLRAYPAKDGGLPPPPEAPNEVYPLVWEIALDDVYFDNAKLPRSTLSSSDITLSALIDTGNSLVRGPQDVIAQIFSSLGGENFDCSTPHNLTFVIGGKPFPVDPRDFIHQTFADSVDQCTAVLASTDPPGEGFFYSWSLGDPFLKSVLAAFYYGNITRPSQDPPRIGLLSTVPPDAAERMQQAAEDAAEGGGNFPATSNSAPSGTFIPAKTGVGGVPQATYVPAPTGSGTPSSALRIGDALCPVRTLALLYAPVMAWLILSYL